MIATVQPNLLQISNVMKSNLTIILGLAFVFGAVLAFASTTSLMADERPSSFDTSERPEGIIAFSSVAPRHWDLYSRDSAGATMQITKTSALDFNAAFSPDGQQIAFVSEREGNMDLYFMNVDGSDVSRLTSLQAMDDHPTWSPDSRQIAFVSTRKRAAAGRAWNGIYVMDADGGNVHRLSGDDAADYSPSWSPRGDWIAFASGRTRPEDLWLMKPDGTERRKLIENGGWPSFINEGAAVVFHREGDGGKWDIWQVNVNGSDPKVLIENASMPRATADGSRLAFVKRGGPHLQIATLDIATGSITDVTNDATPHWSPAISPDGNAIVYHKSTKDQTTPSAEWWASPAETDLKLLRLDGAFPAFSPDKKRVAFISQSFSSVEVMKIDGSQRSSIFKGDRRSLFGASWSPKPEQIAFSHGAVFAAATAKVNIRAAKPDGNELTDVTSDAGNNGFPSYSPDGKKILFRSGRDGAKNLYIMDRDGSNVSRLTNGNWTDTMCDWSPDGHWITFSSDRGDNFEVWLVRPDGTDLRKLIGGGGRNNHPHFSPDGQWIVFTSQRAGYSAEPVSIPRQPQPYGDLFVVRVDGSGLIRLTHNGFEEGTPAWAPNSISN